MGVLEKNRRRGRLLGQDGNTLVTLIAVNLVLFVLINFVKISYFLGGLSLESYYKNFFAWLALPAEGGKLISRPWTILSYMFSHDRVWSLISTLLWLWGFGTILQSLTGNRHVVPIYLYGGLAGALVFVATVNAIPVLRDAAPTMAPLQGGGAAVMAVAVATTTLAPNYRIFPMLNGGIPLWVLTMIFVIIDYALVASAGAGIGLAHLAGGLIGFLYMARYKAGADWGAWMHRAFEWFMNLFEPAAGPPAPDLRKEVFYNTGSQKAFSRKPNVTQQRVDELLDKINQKGYQHLTEEEKEYLRQASQEEL